MVASYYRSQIQLFFAAMQDGHHVLQLQPSLGAWLLGGKFGVLHPDSRGFESHSTHHVGTLGKSFTCV